MRALDEGVLGFADRGDAGEVALDVGGEHRNAGAREAFGQHLQRHGLAGAGRAGDQAVPVAEFQIENFVFAALADDDAVVRYGIGLDRRSSIRNWRSLLASGHSDLFLKFDAFRKLASAANGHYSLCNLRRPAGFSVLRSKVWISVAPSDLDRDDETVFGRGGGDDLRALRQARR